MSRCRRRDVPGEVGELRALALVRVDSDEQRLVWNTLMAHEHPRGAGPFVGHQLRYLVGSAHGWLGAVGFAASNARLQGRAFNYYFRPAPHETDAD